MVTHDQMRAKSSNIGEEYRSRTSKEIGRQRRESDALISVISRYAGAPVEKKSQGHKKENGSRLQQQAQVWPPHNQRAVSEKTRRNHSKSIVLQPDLSDSFWDRGDLEVAPG